MGVGGRSEKDGHFALVYREPRSPEPEESALCIQYKVMQPHCSVYLRDLGMK